jgi:hypothetical protein
MPETLRIRIVIVIGEMSANIATARFAEAGSASAGAMAMIHRPHHVVTSPK